MIKEKTHIDNEPIDGNIKVNSKEANSLLKEHNYRVSNGNVDSFVSLKNINKIYPNGIQAVFDFNLDIHKNDFIVLVGPSGCGKSTTLRMVAGLEDITSGYLYIDKILSNYLPSKNRDISMVFQSYALYPQMTVFENIAFPLKVRKYNKIRKSIKTVCFNELRELLTNKISNLSKAIFESYDKNLNFGNHFEYLSTKLKISDYTSKFIIHFNFRGLTLDLIEKKLLEEKDAILQKASDESNEEISRLLEKGFEVKEDGTVFKNNEPVYVKEKLTKEEIRRKVFEAANILDLGPYLDRRPKELSGGQMQRVALGRAIVRNAKVFLMDEPLSNLDAKLRVQMRSEIVRIHESIGATTIYVTHDQTEAMTMATKIVVMSKGRVQQVGTPQEVYLHPNNLFVATFIGSPAMNIVNGTLEGGEVVLKNGYKVPVDEEFKKAHTAFYNRKIKEVEYMLTLLDNSHEEKAINEYNRIYKFIKGGFNEKMFAKIKETESVGDLTPNEYCLNVLNDIKTIFEDFAKTNKDDILNKLNTLIESVKSNDVEKAKEAAITFDRRLHDMLTLTHGDLNKIYSAQSYAKDKNTSEAKTISYSKKSKKISKKPAKIKVSNKLDPVATKEYLDNLLDTYKQCLEGKHPIKLGVRPEDIHIDNEYSSKTKTNKFTCSPNVVELLGSELLVHYEWCDVDMIAKISTGTLVKSHEDIELTLEKEKLHFFDETSGESII